MKLTIKLTCSRCRKEGRAVADCGKAKSYTIQDGFGQRGQHRFCRECLAEWDQFHKAFWSKKEGAYGTV